MVVHHFSLTCFIEDDVQSQNLSCVIRGAENLESILCSCWGLKMETWRRVFLVLDKWPLSVSDNLLGDAMALLSLALAVTAAMKWNKKGEILQITSDGVRSRCSIVLKNVCSGIKFLSGRLDFMSSWDGNVWKAKEKDSSSGQKGALLRFLWIVLTRWKSCLILEPPWGGWLQCTHFLGLAISWLPKRQRVQA